MRAEVEIARGVEVSEPSKALVPTPDLYSRLRSHIPDTGAVIVVRVASDGTVKGEWLGMTTEDAAMALYAAADAVVDTIPPREHTIH